MSLLGIILYIGSGHVAARVPYLKRNASKGCFNICRDDQKFSSIFFYFDQLKINIIYIITNTNDVSTSSGCSYYHCFRKFKVALNEKIRKII